MDGEPAIDSEKRFDEKIDADERVLNSCIMKDVTTLRHYQGSGDRFIVRRLCVSRGTNFLIGQIANNTFVSFDMGGAGIFYKINNVNNVWHLHGTDTVITQNSRWIFGHGSAHHIKKFTDFRRRLSINDDQITYNVDMTNPTYELVDSDGNWLYALGWGVSNNGKYLVYGGWYGVSYSGAYDLLFRVDMQTGEQRVFGRGYYKYDHSYEPVPSYVISNEGDMVISGGNGTMKVWKISDKCLVSLDEYTKTIRYDDPCKSRQFTPKSQDLLAKVTRQSINRMVVNDDFTKLTYYYSAAGLGDRRVITLSAPRYYPFGRLDYLAMGDSYSSGEGDIDGDGIYYVKNTGSQFDCHLSSRSYPYMLSKYWGLNQITFQSVSCSGARIIHDYTARPEYYVGQNYLTRNKIRSLGKDIVVNEALRDFLPGYIPQLEFVRRYKPRVVTITGGGNDVGFANILTYCASPSWIDATWVNSSCRYAADGSAKQELIYSIRNQYGSISLLIRKIRMVSPETKIYIIGYPQFISNPSVTCAFNAGSLDRKERSMIREMVTEMNNVLWRASTDNGAIFIDVEDSLEGGQLCAGSKYMTGIHQLFPSKVFTGHYQESFHPNALGHFKIAETIRHKVSDPLIGGVSGDRDALSAAVYNSSPVVKMVNIISEHVMKVNSRVKIIVESGQFKPGSVIDIKAYSNEVSLGEFEVNSQGGLSVEITLPENLRPGYHVLLLKGVDMLNNPMKLYQFITVLSVNEDDLDDDGINDKHDKCLFVQNWYDERDGFDICGVDQKANMSVMDGKRNANDALVSESNAKSHILADSGSDIFKYAILLVILFLYGVIIINRRVM